MLFDLEKASGAVAYKLLTGLVAPRPIALITSMDAEGRLNAAPFSAFNYLCTDPAIVGVGISNRPEAAGVLKDTGLNILATREFVVNVVTEDIADKMNICATEFPHEESELEAAGFTTAASAVVKTPRLAEAHAALECRLYQVIDMPRSKIVLGQVVSVYVEDRFVDPKGPYVKAEELHAMGRMNGLGNYARTRDAYVTINRFKYEDWKRGRE